MIRDDIQRLKKLASLDSSPIDVRQACRAAATILAGCVNEGGWLDLEVDPELVDSLALAIRATLSRLSVGSVNNHSTSSFDYLNALPTLLATSMLVEDLEEHRAWDVLRCGYYDWGPEAMMELGRVLAQLRPILLH